MQSSSVVCLMKKVFVSTANVRRSWRIRDGDNEEESVWNDPFVDRRELRRFDVTRHMKCPAAMADSWNMSLMLAGPGHAWTACCFSLVFELQGFPLYRTFY